MNKILPFFVFFVLNFGALALGALLMGNGVISDWYDELNKAPWTPPGWVFGAAWTFIMVCYSIYMGIAWQRVGRNKLIFLFAIQWILNVAWNPVFFYFHNTSLGLLLITSLTLLLLLKILVYQKTLKYTSVLLFPYFVWLCIATSLNAYILLFN